MSLRTTARRLRNAFRSALTPDISPYPVAATPPAPPVPPSPATLQDDFAAREKTEMRQAARLLHGFNLVLGAPKTGTTAAVAALNAMRLPGVIEAAHAVSENLLFAGFLWGGRDIPVTLQEKKIWQLKRHWEVRSQWEMYRKLQREIVRAGGTGKDASGKDARPHVVVTLREPVSRYLSEIYYQDFYEHDAVTVTPEIAQYLMLQRLHPLGHLWWALDEWLDLEVHGEIGVDVFSRPFNAAQGWRIDETPDARVLLIRQESFSRFPEALSVFFDVPAETVKIPKTNLGEENAYADAYRAALAAVRLPAPLLEEIYSGRYARHFYTERERATFIERWKTP